MEYLAWYYAKQLKEARAEIEALREQLSLTVGVGYYPS